MLSKRDTGDWTLTPELQKKYDEVVAHTRRLQKEMGIEPMTLEQRAAHYRKQREEQDKAKEILSKLRPPPKWKI